MATPENPSTSGPSVPAPSTTLNTTLASKLDPKAKRQQANAAGMRALLAALQQQEATIREGGGAKAIDAQHAKQRLTARERIALLLDPSTDLFELGAFAGFDMYAEWGGAPAAGVVCGLGHVSGRLCMIVANDATVKAGAFFPITAKKVLRAQHIAMENHSPPSISSTPPVSSYPCRKTSSPIRTTSAASSATTRACPPRASRRSPPSWACASPAAPICLS